LYFWEKVKSKNCYQPLLVHLSQLQENLLQHQRLPLATATMGKRKSAAEDRAATKMDVDGENDSGSEDVSQT